MVNIRKQGLTGALWMGLALSGLAQEGIRIGDHTVIHPYVETEMAYDDNVFEQENKQDDVYLQYAGGLRLEHQTDSMTFDSSAWMTQRRYDTYTQKDSDRWGAAGALGLFSDKSRLSADVNIRQVDDYDQAPTDGAVPVGFEGTVDQAFDRTNLNKRRRISDFNLGAGRQMTDDMDIAVAYSFYQADYEEDTVGDWDEHSVGTELSLKLTDKTATFLNAQFATQGGDGAAEDGKSTTLRIGLKNSLTDKSTIRIGVGAVHYENKDESYLKPSVEVAGQWSATDKTLFFVSGRNEFQPTGTGNNVRMATRVATGIRYQMSETIGFVLGGTLVHDKDQGGAEERTVIKTGTFLADYTPTDRLSLFARTEFTDANNGASPDYDRFRGTVGMKYTF